MTMTPTEFEERYAEALSGRPAMPRETDDVARGRRLLRRRRLAGTASALGIALVLGGTTYAVSGGRATHTQPPPSAIGKPVDTRTLLRDCRNGNAGKAGVAALFGSGTPIVRALSRVPGHADAALSSRDGRYWAQCSVRSDPQAEFHANMTVYANRGHQDVFESTEGSGCPFKGREPDPGCRTYYYSTIDHRPAAVAAVRFVMADGTTRTVRADHGYFAFSYVGAVPGGRSFDPMSGRPLGTRRITFLDASGTPIAAEVQDGSGSGPDGENVAGLPRLGHYPSLRPSHAVGEWLPPAPDPTGPATLVTPAS